jgi:hypothetical protein
VIALFVVWRIVTLLFGVWSTQVIPVYLPSFGPDNPAWPYYLQAATPDMPLAAWVMPYHRYDTGWYLGIAIDGYSDPAFTAFAPLYPVVVGAFEWLTLGLMGGNFVLAGTLVSTAFALVAFIILYRLAEAHFAAFRPAQAADYALTPIVLLIVFPTAFFLLIPYNESLYLTLVLGMFVALQRERWLLAGVLAALAVLSRFHGIVLVAPMVWVAARHVLAASADLRWKAALRTLPAVLGAPVGAAALLLFVRAQNLADPVTSMGAGWGGTFALPHTIALAYIERALDGTAFWYEHETVVLILLALVVVGLGFRQVRQGRMRMEYMLYAGATLLLSLSLPGIGPQYGSVSRHLVLLFPCFFVLASLFHGRRTMPVIVVLSALYQLILIVRFTHWVWVA